MSLGYRVNTRIRSHIISCRKGGIKRDSGDDERPAYEVRGRRCLRGAYELVAEQKASARNTREQSAGSLIVYGRTELEPRTHLALAARKTLTNHKKSARPCRPVRALVSLLVRNHCHSSLPARHPAAAPCAAQRTKKSLTQCSAKKYCAGLREAARKRHRTPPRGHRQSLRRRRVPLNITAI